MFVFKTDFDYSLATIIALGGTSESNTDFEVISLKPDSNSNNWHCELSSDVVKPPVSILGGSGELLLTPDEKYFFCGGFSFDWSYPLDSCHVFALNTKAQHVEVSTSMAIPRQYHASFLIGPETLFVSGGSTLNWKLFNSTEYVQPGLPATPGPDLPYPVEMHCMIKVNVSIGILAGGRTWDGLNPEPTEQTLAYDIDINQWSIQPKVLMTARYASACGRVVDRWTGDPVAIIVGGFDRSNEKLTTAEQWSPISEEWIDGPTLINPVAHAKIVQQDQDIFGYLVGGSEGYAGRRILRFQKQFIHY